METAASEMPDQANVVSLTNGIMRDGPAAVTELERKRAIMFRAFTLTAAQLEHDAQEMEKHFILDEMPMEQRYKMMHTAEALRIAHSWITAGLLPSPEKPNA